RRYRAGEFQLVDLLAELSQRHQGPRETPVCLTAEYTVAQPRRVAQVTGGRGQRGRRRRQAWRGNDRVRAVGAEQRGRLVTDTTDRARAPAPGPVLFFERNFRTTETGIRLEVQ